MKAALLAFFLTASLLKHLSPVDGSKETRDTKPPLQSLDGKCNAYCFSLLRPVLDNYVQIKPEADYLKNMSGTIEDLKNKLFLANSQLKYKEDVIIEKNELIREKGEILKEKNELIMEQLRLKDDKANVASAACQVQTKELVNAKVREINDHVVQLKENDILIKLKDEKIELLSEQLRIKGEKVNDITAKIKDLQARLESAERLLGVKNAEISAKAEELKTKDGIISDQSEAIKNNDEKVSNMTANIEYLKGQIQAKEDLLNAKAMELKSKDEEANVKSNQLKLLNEQILGKDKEIDALNQKIKSHSETITQDSCPKGRPGGTYKINVKGMDMFEAPCNSSGWMTIQRRQDGSVSFERNWDDYKNGFGDLKTEFFIGLEKLHQLTKKRHELYLRLELNGTSKFARYDNFKIGSEQQQYELSSIGTYSGTAGDSLVYQTNMKFSTFDRDNDNSPENCARKYPGGGWFNNCFMSHLNGIYHTSGKCPERGVSWYYWDGLYTTSLTFVEMMIRPVS
ncbi:fibrinogen-like protein 1 isoform X1 [Drosophila biarmipes]|uniref:fibrinogen-like protein 1 isoform X1 n=1 Tax=Drosophila biarmipes TaxID=125945 RepID=UPI0007E81689|nr:fibrinogen-like protein 1 isoform X1 [Drosophila biarmipes]